MMELIAELISKLYVIGFFTLCFTGLIITIVEIITDNGTRESRDKSKDYNR
jgi:hypothetical protein